jgi:hypothetical protein
MADVQTCEVNLKQFMWDHEILYADISPKKENFYSDQSCEGHLNVKIHILFYGDNSWTVALR